MSREMKTADEIAIILADEKDKGNGRSRRLYKREADELKGEQLQTDIANKTEVLRAVASRNKVDFSDLEQVRSRTFAYMKACEKAGVYPSVMGLAVHGFGVSRQALNQYLLRNNNATTDFINMAKDCFADILTNASLYNSCNPIQAIFQLKNHFGHSDRVEIVPTGAERTDRDFDPDEIRRRYLPGSVVDDTEE